MQACDRCHARKTRCDRRLPSCTACEKAGTPCLHRDKLRQRHLPRGYVDGIESKLQNITEENIKLRRELAELRIAGGTEHNTSPREPTRSPTDVSENANASLLEDAVSNEVGYLSLKATGETRYVGMSSGIGLASIMSRMVDGATGLSLVSTDTRDINLSASNISGSIGENSSIQTKRSTQPFIEAYFQHTHITFPLLHRTTFLEMVEKIHADAEYYSSHTYDAFVFDMVLSIGSSNFNRFGDTSAASAVYYAQAQAKLPTVLEMPGLIPLKAILLLSQHGIFSNLRDTSASIWHLIGIGVRICYEMGLHVEPRRRDRPGLNDAHSGGVSFEEEMNRRCFWCLYNLDRVVSFTLGRPTAIKDDDIDVSLPTPYDDEDFSPGKVVPQRRTADPRVSPFLHLIHIRRLSGQILAAFYSVKQTLQLTYHERRQLRQSIHDKVKAWHDSTIRLNLPSRSKSDGSFTSCFLSSEWYTAVFNNAVLLLYRPSPSFPHFASAAGQNNEEGDLMHLFSAAKASINAYAELHNKRRLNYSWITLHGVFIAGLAYVYCIGRALKDPSRTSPIPDYLEIINDTRACSNVLVAICERWNVVRPSCELFNKLSNAVIRDVVNDAAKQQCRQAPQGSESAARLGNRDKQTTSNTGQDATMMHDDPLDFGPNESNEIVEDEPLMSDPFFVADEFNHFLETFNGAASYGQALPSELVMGFSQNWPFDDSLANQSGYGMHMQHDMWP